MKKLMLSIALLPTVLFGCASADKHHFPVANAVAKTQAEPAFGNVLIYRTQNLQGSLAKAYIGSEHGYFSKLGTNQYLQFSIDPGFHTFKARAHGSVASTSTIKVMPGETLCIEARPNHEEMEWLAVPFVNALIPSFVLKETTCPSPADLTALSAV